MARVDRNPVREAVDFVDEQNAWGLLPRGGEVIPHRLDDVLEV